MDKTNYYQKLCAVRDKVAGTIQLIGNSESLGVFTRNSIPVFAKNGTPLKDLEILELGEINLFTGEIKQYEDSKNGEAVKAYEWEDLYKFNVTNKAVENESQTATETEKE